LFARVSKTKIFEEKMQKQNPRKNAATIRKCVGSINGKCANQAVSKAKAGRKGTYRCMTCIKVNSLERAVDNLFYSNHGRSIINVIRQAGTIETFQAIDDLDFYVSLNKECRSYGSVKSGKVQTEFHRCHLVPANGVDTVGLTNEINMIAGEATVNQSYKNKNLFTQAREGVHYLCRDRLQDRWLVDKTTTTPDIKHMMMERFGVELKEWAKLKRFAPPSKGDYELRAREAEKLIVVMQAQLFSEAGLSINWDLEPLFNFGQAWSDFLTWAAGNRNWEVKYTEYGMEVEHNYLGADEFLEPVGKMLQEFMFTGDIDWLRRAEDQLAEITGSVMSKNRDLMLYCCLNSGQSWT